MRNLGKILFIALFGAALWGCRDNSPAVAPVIPPDIGQDTYRREADYPKPLPNQTPSTVAPVNPADNTAPPPAVDNPPQDQSFLGVYGRVNRPRIVVYVNRGLDGHLLPARDPRTGQAVALAEDQKADVDDAGVDYTTIESLLADTLSCDGKVTIISPSTVRSRFNDDQIKDLQAGKDSVLPILSESLQGHVIVQVQVRGIKKTDSGPDVRMYAQAVNVRGSDLLASAAVDVHPPLNKGQLSRSTKALAQQIMSGLAATWAQPMPQPTKATTPAKTNDATDAIPVSEEPKTGKKLPPPLPPPPPANND